jgi:putative endonuclease
MNKYGFVYILTNKNKTTLYVGVTNDLVRRIYEHKNHIIKNSFTDKYNLEYCIYYEEFPYFDLAIQREKELKKWNRQKKEALINKKNPEWKELVNEKGIVRNGEKVPLCVRNDDLLHENEGEEGAAEKPPLPPPPCASTNAHVISSVARNLPHSEPHHIKPNKQKTKSCGKIFLALQSKNVKVS